MTHQLLALKKYVESRCGPELPVIPISFGELSLDILDAPTSWRSKNAIPTAPINSSVEAFIEKPLPETGFLVARNVGDV